MKGKARDLRKNQTDAERLLWYYLRDRCLAGHKFRRQHPIGPFIVDFVCIERRLIFELDGGQHGLRVEEDTERSRYLESKHYRAVRFLGRSGFERKRSCPSPRPSPPRRMEREAKGSKGVKFA